MTQKLINDLLPAITHWAKGGKLWYYDDMLGWTEYNSANTPTFNTSDKKCYIIEDNHFEARKAFAFGESIEERYNEYYEWIEVKKPLWTIGEQYRSKSKLWYHNIPKEGILCWVGDHNKQELVATYIISKTKYFNDLRENEWLEAIPVKPSECYQGEPDE